MLWGIITRTNVDYAKLMWEEFIQAIQTFLVDKANMGIASKKDKKSKPHVIPYCWFANLIIYHLGRKHNIHQRSGSPFNMAEDDHRLGNLKFVPKGEEDEVFGMQIPKELITDNIRNAPYYNAYLEVVAKHDRKIVAAEGGKKRSASKTDQSKKPASAKQPKPVSLQLVDEPDEEQAQPEPKPEPEPQGEQVDYDLQRGIQMSLESFQPPVGGVAFREPASGITQKLPIVEGKGKGIATDEQVAQSLLELQMPKKTSTTDQYIFQRRIPVTEEASTRPSAQPEDDTSANIVRDTPSPTDAETGAETDKTNSEGDTEILNIGEEQGEDVADKVDLEEKTAKVDEGQAGSDPGKTPESRPPLEHTHMEEDQAGPNPGQSHVALAGPNPEPMHEDFVATVYPQVHESLKHPDEEHVYLENPLSSTGTLSSMKNLDNFTFGDKFIADKSPEDEPRNANMEIKVESMVTVPIHQASSSVPPLSTPVIDLSPPKPVSSPAQAPTFTATTTTTTTTLPLPPPPQQQSSSDPDLASRVSALEQGDEFLEATTKSRKRRRDDQDPHPPPPDSDQGKKKRHNSDASAPHQPQAQMYSTWITTDTRDAPLSTSKQKTTSQSEQPIEDVPIPDDVHISDSEDIGAASLPKIKTIHDWLKPIPEEDRLETSELDWTVPLNDLPETKNNWANAFATSYKDPEENKLLQKTGDMSSFIKCKERRSALSISKLKAANYPDFGLEELVPSLWIECKREYDTYERYGYTFLKEIVLRKVDYNEHKILEANFKNLHQNDFEDMYLLHLQGKLNHLSGADKVHLFNAVNLWIRKIVIRKRVKDLQPGIKSYQTKLNLTQPNWDASDFLFKEDYTIVFKPGR
ncbi:hypothetical protein Tco_0378557 [Tanacetum coccineum]